MEVFCRYLGKHLFHDGVRVNIVRSRPVVTESFNATFGDDFAPFLQRNYGDRYFITADEVGKAILALCSGWFDAMTGQVILLDRGVAFSDNLMGMFERRAELGLE
jgi:enoyl-[acyl-carrier-protein] reductase (NADH)